ncbi:nucleoside 2-deoxyribosyltransferase [Ruania alba]|uniref:Nucleoside 2-deoxyribosyltransferase n=1 Tax=Ruania alba TaxID=648782 RepID=A0A1H5CP89_9MICO|nr:nucleoside 2-deoxyribosyltransferase [Ruania alba]SED68539.1 Nucleoside 2-deoxyribosyltransferase [Ruania alba]
MTLTVYLAGPEVFLHDGRELIEHKRELACTYGFAPAELHGEFAAHADTDHLGLAISRRNEVLMDSADLCIANLTPFRGISADPGTVYEVGYMIASKKPTFAYTNDPRSYADRVAEVFGPLEESDGALRLADGGVVENHGWSDNLMMEGGIASRGWAMVRTTVRPEDLWRDLEVFTECLDRARSALRTDH